jgi:hypothetical protein
VVVDAFPSAPEIRETWGLDIANALDEPERRMRIIQRARSIAACALRPSAEDVYRRLMHSSSGKGTAIKKVAHDEVVVGQAGHPLFRIRYQRKAVALVVPAGKLSEQRLASLRSVVKEFLESAGGARDGSEAPPWRLTAVPTVRRVAAGE